jgi:hypothetical protein
MLGVACACSVFFCCSRREFLREPLCDESDLSRGEMGHCCALAAPRCDSSSAGVAPPFTPIARGACARGSFEGGSADGVVTVVGCSCGVLLAAYSARWIAAAEGTVAVAPPERPGGRCGDTSWEGLREPELPLLSVEATRWGWRCEARAGDESREERGEAKAEGEPDALRVYAVFAEPLIGFTCGTMVFDSAACAVAGV